LKNEELDYLRTQWSDGHLQTLPIKLELADLLESQGKYADAHAMSQETLNIYRDKLGDHSPTTQATILFVSGLLKDMKDFDKAEQLAREALALGRYVSDTYENTLYSLRNLASILQEKEDWEEAESLLAEALATNRNLFGEKAQLTLETMGELGDLLLAMGNIVDAQQHLEQAFETSEHVYGRGHPLTVKLIGQMGKLRQAQGDNAKAEAFLVECFEVNKNTRSLEHEKTRDAIEALIVFYDETDQQVESQKYSDVLP